MYDILPESSGTPAQSSRPMNLPSSNTQKIVHAGPRVVQVEWKLPSRLRKPIRQQLAKERAQRKRRATAAVTFARKPIRTHALLEARPTVRPAARVQKPRRFFNRGAEHHTGDVYTQSKPQLRVSAPPYLGRVARKTVNVERRATLPPQQVRRTAKQPVARPKIQPRVQPGRSAMPYAERDIPMQWQKTSVPVQQESTEELFAPVQKPKKVLPGITFSLWPGNWFGSKKSPTAFVDDTASEQVHEFVGTQPAPRKKKRLIF